MYASIHDSVRALAKKLGADPNGAAVEDTLNNIAKKLGGDPVKAKGISKAIDAITAVADIDDMHNVGKLNVTPTTSAQTLTPESPLDGWDEVKVSAVTSDIDENIVAGNIKKDVAILGVTGSYEAVSENNAKFGNTPQAFSLIQNLTSIDIPSGVTSIAANTFQTCIRLASIEIPSSVTSIGNNAFYSCSGLTAIEIPSSVTSIGTQAFYNCSSLASIEIPSSVTNIGDYAFQNCTNLETITIHKAEGSITGAPWGATNATVVWDG